MIFRSCRKQSQLIKCIFSYFRGFSFYSKKNNELRVFITYGLKHTNSKNYFIQKLFIYILVKCKRLIVYRIFEILAKKTLVFYFMKNYVIWSKFLFYSVSYDLEMWPRPPRPWASSPKCSMIIRNLIGANFWKDAQINDHGVHNERLKNVTKIAFTLGWRYFYFHIINFKKHNLK